MKLVISSFLYALILYSFVLGFSWMLIKRKRRFHKKDWIIQLFLFYLLFLFCITVFRFGTQRNSEGVIAFIPFLDYIKLLANGKTIEFIYLFFGNMVWFIPFGILVPRMKNCSFLKTVAFTFLLSLLIEILQFFFLSGISEIDDLILNTLGGIIGYCIYRLFNKEVKQ